MSTQVECYICLDLFDSINTVERLCCRRQLCLLCLTESPSCLLCGNVATTEVNLEQLRQEIILIQEIAQEQAEFYAKHAQGPAAAEAQAAYQADTKAIQLHLELLQDLRQRLTSTQTNDSAKTVSIPLNPPVRSKDDINLDLDDELTNSNGILRANTITEQDFFECHRLPYHWSGHATSQSLPVEIKSWRYLRSLTWFNSYFEPNCDHYDPGLLDLTDLSDLPLQHLNIFVTKLVNLPAITALNETLTGLNIIIWSNDDLTILAKLTNLTSLFLFDSDITDITALAGLKLDSLNLSYTLVSDLTAVVNMPLESLYLCETKVVDITPLGRLTKLQHLDISDNVIADISVLKGMALITLDLSHTQVSDLSVLAGMPLTYLDVSNTKVGDFTAVEGIVGLELVR